MGWSTDMDRRQFMTTAAAGGAALLLGGSTTNDTVIPPPNPRTPLGTLFLVGGGYPTHESATLPQRIHAMSPDEADPQGIFRKMIALTGKAAPVVEIISSASAQYAIEDGESHRAMFKHLGAGEVNLTTSRNPASIAQDTKLAERIKKADIVYITGGNQADLTRLFLHTRTLDAMRDRYARDKDFVIGGTSAGAMCMARQMIDGNNKVKGACPPMLAGFAMLPLIVETHMDSIKRESRERRLLHAVAAHPECIGIGLDNATAAVIQNGQVSAMGEGRVLLAFHNQHRMDLPSESKVEVTTLRECPDFGEKNLNAHCFRTGQTFVLGSHNQIPALQAPLNAQASARQ